MYSRILEEKIKKKLFKGKAIFIVGPRQVGKTTLAKTLINKSKFSEKTISFNCDYLDIREQLNNINESLLENIISTAKIIFIDEGQKVENIGQTIKILVDHFKEKKQVIVTGSSSFNLLNKTKEPLTGRKYVYSLYPLSVEEIYSKNNLQKLYKELEMILIYGSYPDIVNESSIVEKRKLLNEITFSYLYKDVLELNQVKSPDALIKILKALSLQIGREVSYNEISSLVGIDVKTVERYIDLLEKNYVLFKLPPFSRNKRKEITKKNKIYFYDLGIRNTLINNFNLVNMRDDIGQLFENFMVVERLKHREYHEIFANQFFWRTFDGDEVDLIEEKDGKLSGYEFKWNPKKSLRRPTSFLSYKGTSYKGLSKDDIKGFII